MDTGCVVAVRVEGRKQLADGGLDLAEGADDESHLVFQNPVGVVALLREGPDIPFDDDRQMHGDGFADASRAGFADEEVSEPHVVGNFGCELLDEPGLRAGLRAKLCGKRAIAAANQDLLERETAGVEAGGDVEHGRGAFPTEHDERGGQAGFEAKAAAFRSLVDVDGLVELRAEDHAGSAKNAIFGVTKLSRLLDGAIGTANEALRLAFDPEVGRVVGYVGEDGDIGGGGAGGAKAVEEDAVEVGDDGDDEVGPGGSPVVLENADGRVVVQADNPVNDFEYLCSAEGPAFGEHAVVEILQPYSGDFTENIERIEQFLKVDQAHLPGTILIAANGAERIRCGAMPAPSIKIDEIDCGHTLFKHSDSWTFRRGVISL